MAYYEHSLPPTTLCHWSLQSLLLANIPWLKIEWLHIIFSWRTGFRTSKFTTPTLSTMSMGTWPSIFMISWSYLGQSVRGGVSLSKDISNVYHTTINTVSQLVKLKDSMLIFVLRPTWGYNVSFFYQSCTLEAVASSSRLSCNTQGMSSHLRQGLWSCWCDTSTSQIGSRSCPFCVQGHYPESTCRFTCSSCCVTCVGLCIEKSCRSRKVEDMQCFKYDDFVVLLSPHPVCPGSSYLEHTFMHVMIHRRI